MNNIADFPSDSFRVTPCDDSHERKNPFQHEKKDKKKRSKIIDEKINELVKEAIKEEKTNKEIAEIKNLKVVLEKDGIEAVAIKLLQILEKKL